MGDLSAGLKVGRKSVGEINGISGQFERQRAWMDLLDGLAADEFAAVADEYQGMIHLDRGRTEMEMLFQAWGKQDPLGAMAYIEEHPGAGRHRDEVLESWAAMDVAGAERWAKDAYNGDGANPYLASIVKGIAMTDMGKAAELTQSMPLSRERGQAIDAMAKALLLQGRETAFAFPETIKDEHLRGSFVMMISNNLLRKDPQAAADWVLGMKSPQLQERAAAEISDALSKKDARSAQAFVDRLQPGARTLAAAAAVEGLSKIDIAGTATWLKTFAGTRGFDQAVVKFVMSCDERAPEQSAAWISGISDVRTREKVYRRMLGEWGKRDQAGMKNWVAQNEVPEKIRGMFGQ